MAAVVLPEFARNLPSKTQSTAFHESAGRIKTFAGPSLGTAVRTLRPLSLHLCLKPVLGLQRCLTNRASPSLEPRYCVVAFTPEPVQLTLILSHPRFAAHRAIHGITHFWSLYRSLCHRDLDPPLQGEETESIGSQQKALRHLHDHVDIIRNGSSDYISFAVTLEFDPSAAPSYRLETGRPSIRGGRWQATRRGGFL